MSAEGKVCIGFCCPYVALYHAEGTTVTHSNGMPLARGVEISVEATASEDNKFYANNRVAESTAGRFNGGNATITVDGLLAAARRLILGLPEADSNGFTPYGDAMVVPYVSFGFARMYMSDGVITYTPTILAKIRFGIPRDAARTSGDDIEWQTEELSAAIERDDTTGHNWKYDGSDMSTEAAAEAAIKTFLGIA